MTKIKMCGMCREQDVEYANKVLPEYIGYIFVKKSRRYISPETAAKFTELLDKRIIPVGVFIDEDIHNIARLVNIGTIRAVQLHGNEDDEYISALREQVKVPVIKAFKVRNTGDVEQAECSSADMILLDSGEGSGELFDHSFLKNIRREYFLAGGLSPANIRNVLEQLVPYAVDVSSGIETDGVKDLKKMQSFAELVRS